MSFRVDSQPQEVVVRGHCNETNSPIPVRTRKPVMNRPKSIAELLELSIKSSGFATRPQIQLGSGAMT